MKNDHKTAHTILRAAQEVFIEKGFDGSSINDIAAKAQVNKSLIYHHFGNKEELWRSVKSELLQSYLGKDLTNIKFDTHLTFKEFLTQIVTLRYHFYEKNPSIVRLISWQRLEKNQNNIQGLGKENIDTLAPQIREFQQRGEIDPSLDPQMVSYFITSTTSMPFMDKPDFLNKSPQHKASKEYLEMIIELLYKALALSSSLPKTK